MALVYAVLSALVDFLITYFKGFVKDFGETALAVSFGLCLLFIASSRHFLPLFFHNGYGLHQQHSQFIPKIHALKHQSFP